MWVCGCSVLHHAQIEGRAVTVQFLAWTERKHVPADWD